MKLVKPVYLLFALVLIALIAYVQLSMLPGLRQCIFRSSGVSIPQADRIADLLTVCTGPTLIISVLLLGNLLILFVFIMVRKFDQIYDYLAAKNKTWLIPIAVSAAAALPYLSMGNALQADLMQSAAVSIFVRESIFALAYPYWSFMWYMGFSPFAFHHWFFFVMAGLLSALTGIDFAQKILFFSFHIGSVLAAYFFIASVTKSQKAAIVGSLVFALSLEHMGRIFSGRSITSFIYLLMPFLFLLFERRLDRKISARIYVALLGIIISLMFFTHALDPAFIVAFFILYAILSLWQRSRLRIRHLRELFLALALAFLVMSFWVIPFILEMGEASGSGKVLSTLSLHAPDLEQVSDMLLWPGIGGIKAVFYLGVVAVVLAAVGILSLLRQRMYAIPVATLSVFLLLIVQTPRHAPIALLMLSVSAAYGFLHLNQRLRRNFLLAVIILLCVDMIPASFQLGYPDFTYLNNFASIIEADDGQRILDLSTDRRTFWPSYVYIYNQQETVFGTIIEGAPTSIAYATAIAQSAAEEYYDKDEPLSNRTEQGFYLLGVKSVILHGEQRGKDSSQVYREKRGSLGLERNLSVITLDHWSPVIASANLQRIDYDSYLSEEQIPGLRIPFEKREIDTTEIDNLLSIMDIDMARSTAKTILTKSGETPIAPPSADPPNLDVRDVENTLGQVSIDYEVDTETYLQLSYSYSDHIRVSIDKIPVEYRKSAIDTIVVRSEAGSHTVTIEGVQSPVRKVFFITSLLGIMIIAFLLISARKRRLQ